MSAATADRLATLAIVMLLPLAGAFVVVMVTEAIRAVLDARAIRREWLVPRCLRGRR